jgi:hypothetical protein
VVGNGTVARTQSREGNGSPAPQTGVKTADQLEAVFLRLALAEQQGRRLHGIAWTLAGLWVVTAVVAAAALLAPYNGTLRGQLDRVLGRDEASAVGGATVEAQRIVLRGREGEVRGELALRDDGSLGLHLYDRAGKVRAALVAAAAGPASLTLTGDEGQPGVTITPGNLRFTDKDGGAFLTSTSLGLTSWDVQDARSGVWLGARPDGTSALTLADRKGKTRMGLALRADGQPSVTLFDKEGRNGAVLDVPADGSRLGLFADGVARVGVGYGPGGSQLTLAGQDGGERVSIRNLADGGTGVFVSDPSGRQRIAMGVQPEGASGLSLFDRRGTHRAALSLSGEEAPQLLLFDGAGGRRASLALTEDGVPGLRYEEKGRTRAVFGAQEDKVRSTGPAALVLFDKDGAILFQAPIL